MTDERWLCEECVFFFEIGPNGFDIFESIFSINIFSFRSCSRFIYVLDVYFIAVIYLLTQLQLIKITNSCKNGSFCKYLERKLAHLQRLENLPILWFCSKYLDKVCENIYNSTCLN